MLKQLLLVAITASFIAVGCGESSTGSGKPKLVYIAKNTGNPYFDPLIQGFKDAAAEQGCEVVTVAPATADATSQLPLIEDQIQQGVGAIALSPNSTEALNRVLDEAMAKGIAVITVDSDLTNNEKSRTVAVKTADPQSVGEGQIELLGSLIGYSGKFAILSATTDAPNQNEWIGIMKKTLETNPKYKNMQLVETAYGNDEPQKSLTEAEALLTKYPDLKGIVAPTTVGVAAAAQAVETAKKADTVFVTGLGTPNQMRRFIQNGTVKAFALWSPYDEGYLAGQVAAQLAKKSLTIKSGTKIQAGKLGEREVREKSVIITGPPTVFTKENIDQFHF
ncbi:MAG: substrate-binding domain-containing protein [Burkholderiales bacterium]|nr:substrate-binding domain-containing protein [Phycisphaerae bacterium]